MANQRESAAGKSTIIIEGSQRKTLIGLGLSKIGRVKELEDTPAVRGMI